MKTKIRAPKQEIVQKIRDLAKKRRIKVRFWAMPYDAYGECRLDGKLISLNKKASKQELLHSFFHELGHLYCIRQGIWKRFHRNYPMGSKQTFRIENWVEKWASKEWGKEKMHKEFGHFKYYYAKKNRAACLNWIAQNC